MGFWDFLTGDTKKTDGSIPPPAIEPPDPPAAAAPKVARSAAPPPVAPAPKTPASPPAPPALRYDIDKANELMATIDVDDDPEPVVRVIRKTLESAGVAIPELIADGKRRESDLRDNIGKRRTTIADLERQIQAERNEIATLEASLVRTGKTRGHLELAEQNRTQIRQPFTGGAPPPVPEKPAVFSGTPPSAAATGKSPPASLPEEARPKGSAPPPPLPSKAPAKSSDAS